MVAQYQTIKISSGNARYYEPLGYEIKRGKDKRGRNIILPQLLEVNINDIPKHSKIKIEVICDYCGDIFYESVENYHIAHFIIPKDCCNNCIKHKILESKQAKYNSINPVEISKINETNVGRNKKYKLNDVIEQCTSKDYTIISEVPNIPCVKDRIILKCNLHNQEFETSINGLMNDVDNCPICSGIKIGNINSKSDISMVKKLCNKKDYLLLTDIIHTCDDTVEYICNKHKEYGIQTTSLYGLQHFENNCSMCKRKRGENHYNWQGGKSAQRDTIKNSIKYKFWVKSVFERDEYTCTHCGKTGSEVKLNAHHIENFSSNPDKRFDVDNGITLCEQCHLPTYKGSFHSIYGVYNNNLQQIIEFNKNYKEIYKWQR